MSLGALGRAGVGEPGVEMTTLVRGGGRRVGDEGMWSGLVGARVECASLVNGS